jgi:hypothetical protein
MAMTPRISILAVAPEVSFDGTVREGRAPALSKMTCAPLKLRLKEVPSKQSRRAQPRCPNGQKIGVLITQFVRVNAEEWECTSRLEVNTHDARL